MTSSRAESSALAGGLGDGQGHHHHQEGLDIKVFGKPAVIADDGDLRPQLVDEGLLKRGDGCGDEWIVLRSRLGIETSPTDVTIGEGQSIGLERRVEEL